MAGPLVVQLDKSLKIIHIFYRSNYYAILLIITDNSYAYRALIKIQILFKFIFTYI